MAFMYFIIIIYVTIQVTSHPASSLYSFGKSHEQRGINIQHGVTCAVHQEMMQHIVMLEPVKRLVLIGMRRSDQWQGDMHHTMSSRSKSEKVLSCALR